jgi:hypothetical protein
VERPFERNVMVREEILILLHPLTVRRQLLGREVRAARLEFAVQLTALATGRAHTEFVGVLNIRSIHARGEADRRTHGSPQSVARKAHCGHNRGKCLSGFAWSHDPQSSGGVPVRMTSPD